MGKPLTAELILQRTKADSLENVKNLNLWGNEIDDIRIIRNMPNVEILFAQREQDQLTQRLQLLPQTYGDLPAEELDFGPRRSQVPRETA